MTKSSFNMVTRADPDYPPLLRMIKDPPEKLYYRGNLSLASRTCIAVVGSRHGTAYGRWVARLLGSKMARHRIPLVSGLAAGIDAAGHQAALDHQGDTIAVLGTGIDICYPRSNRHLMNEIEDKGLLLTEYPPGFRATSYSFPARNRIISGLAAATIVVEAGISSGSLITAGFSEDQGRRTYAVPGNINSIFSAGTNRLICDGALPLIAFEDVLDDLGIPRIQEEEIRNTLGKDEILIYQAICEGGEMTVDELCRKTGRSPSQVNALVTIMEMKGILWTSLGKVFIAN